MHPPIVSLVGRPDSGKTTLLERLLPELGRRGIRVGTIKHHVHAFEMDTPGKDTWRHKKAGAHTICLSSPTGLGVIRDVDYDHPVEELVARYFTEVDLVIVEGYKKAQLAKIEVFRQEISPSPLPGRDHTWHAFVTDDQVQTDLPCFSPSDIKGIADFIQERFLRARPASTLHLAVDGKSLHLPRPISFLLTGLLAAAARLCGTRLQSQATLSFRTRRNP